MYMCVVLSGDSEDGGGDVCSEGQSDEECAVQVHGREDKGGHLRRHPAQRLPASSRCHSSRSTLTNYFHLI